MNAVKTKKYAEIPAAVIMSAVTTASKSKTRNFVTAPQLADRYASEKNGAGAPRRGAARRTMHVLAEEGKIQLWSFGNTLAATLPNVKELVNN